MHPRRPRPDGRQRPRLGHRGPGCSPPAPLSFAASPGVAEALPEPTRYAQAIGLDRGLRSAQITRVPARWRQSTESIFIDEGEGRFTPTEHARGPWDPRALHGGAPAALIAAAFERIEPGAELPMARLSFSFLRPIPMAPLQLTTRVTRPGRRVQELEADLHADGVLVCQARALRLSPRPRSCPSSRWPVADHTPPPLSPPQEGHPIRFALDDPDHKSFAATAMEMRFLRASPLRASCPRWMPPGARPRRPRRGVDAPASPPAHR